MKRQIRFWTGNHVPLNNSASFCSPLAVTRSHFPAKWIRFHFHCSQHHSVWTGEKEIPQAQLVKDNKGTWQHESRAGMHQSCDQGASVICMWHAQGMHGGTLDWGVRVGELVLCTTIRTRTTMATATMTNDRPVNQIGRPKHFSCTTSTWKRRLIPTTDGEESIQWFIFSDSNLQLTPVSCCARTSSHLDIDVWRGFLRLHHQLLHVRIVITPLKFMQQLVFPGLQCTRDTHTKVQTRHSRLWRCFRMEEQKKTTMVTRIWVNKVALLSEARPTNPPGLPSRSCPASRHQEFPCNLQDIFFSHKMKKHDALTIPVALSSWLMSTRCRKAGVPRIQIQSHQKSLARSNKPSSLLDSSGCCCWMCCCCCCSPLVGLLLTWGTRVVSL